MCCRWMGNVFNEGLYDIHIHLRKLPFLEDELSMEAVKVRHGRCVPEYT